MAFEAWILRPQRKLCCANPCIMTKPARNISISFRPCIKAFGEAIPMPRSTGWLECWKRARTRSTSRGGSSGWPRRTLGLPTRLALVQTVNAFQAYHFLGSPEGELALAQAVVYLCLAPKSNSLYIALERELEMPPKRAAPPGCLCICAMHRQDS